MDALLAQSYGFFLLLLRTAGLCIALPGVGARVVPPRIRLSFALAITVPVFLAAGRPSPTLPATMIGLAGTAIGETLLGLAAGFACQLTILAAVGAGQLASTSMGLGMGHVIDHIYGAQSSVVSEIVSQLAVCTAIGLGLHREVVGWLCREAIAVPPGTAVNVSALMMATITHAVESASMCFRLAFPFLAAINVGHLAFGLLGKTSQQLNLHNLGFSLSILVGGAALYLAAPMAAEYAAQAAIAAFTRS